MPIVSGVYKIDNCVGQGACHLHANGSCNGFCLTNTYAVVYGHFDACGTECTGNTSLPAGPACESSMGVDTCHSIWSGELWECLGSTATANAIVCGPHTGTLLGSVNAAMFTGLCGGTCTLGDGTGWASWGW
jgi:hypothetical protein